MKNNTTSLPSEEDPVPEFSGSITGYHNPAEPISGGSNRHASVEFGKIVEIIGLIGGIIALILFIVNIIITQNNISNNIATLSHNIDDYKNDNIVIKTQIENWFSRIDSKLDNLKDIIKK